MSGTMRDDTVNLHAEMLEARQHYLNNRPKLASGLDNRLAPLFDLMDGLVNQQVRLAREVQEIHETGGLDVRLVANAATAKVIEDLHT